MAGIDARPLRSLPSSNGAELAGSGRMSMPPLNRRAFLYRSALASLLAQLPVRSQEQPARDESRVPITPGPPEGGRVILDPAMFPKRLAESPLVAEQVRLGRLPPIHERIGQDPLVIQPLHEIG